MIYNRWGEQIFETTDPAFTWDGYYKNRPELTSLFVYVMKATLIDGTELRKAENVSLIG